MSNLLSFLVTLFFFFSDCSQKQNRDIEFLRPEIFETFCTSTDLTHLSYKDWRRVNRDCTMRCGMREECSLECLKQLDISSGCARCLYANMECLHNKCPECFNSPRPDQCARCRARSCPIACAR
eukprot:TRINITY_DN16127_c0_g1_i2.p1 TRINITY_DN16127_c0_g1~~TRINITY_DN16127_c0_g1_i2.p1  ORF type:complete len:124 (+),score=6.47 TRINITY_DN16127_c0_g1_i2:87-458(+)